MHKYETAMLYSWIRWIPLSPLIDKAAVSNPASSIFMGHVYTVESISYTAVATTEMHNGPNMGI